MTERTGEPAVPDLSGAQRTIRDAFFNHESGLFVLDCNPGAGKSTVADQVAAEALIASHENGEVAPERRLCVTSFAREDAAAIDTGVEAALQAFAAREDPPIDIDPTQARDLARRLHRSDTVGTIDSVIRSVFADIAHEVGFDGMPSIGNEALLAILHEDCLEPLREDPDQADRIDRLDAAYPGGEYTAGLDELLVTALAAVRERRISIEVFEARLRKTIADAYPDGPPADFDDVRRDIERFVDESTAARTAASFDAADRATFVAADHGCHTAWTDAVEDFCGLLQAFEPLYDTRTRGRGVASHRDIAYWVAEYFRNDEHGSEYREHRRAQYATRLDTVIVDEAQDVSVVQHDALAPFIDADTRVLLVGDRKQCIYAWRNARPRLFQRAIEEGHYFGVDWNTHEMRRAVRTYRCRPAVATAVNTVFGGVFDDPARGGAGSLVIDQSPLVADRAPVDGPNVHIAAYRSDTRPGSSAWATDEARVLATYLAGAFDDGTFDTADTTGEPFPSLTVLFPRRTHMDVFADAFEAKGLSVADASQHLFDHPVTRVAVAVVRWLLDPFDPDRVEALLGADCIPDAVAEVVAAHDGSIERAAMARAELSDGVATTLKGLAELASRHGTHATDSGAAVITDVADRLSLAADPIDVAGPEEGDRCVVAVDALLDYVAEWEGGDRYTLPELAAILDRYATTPSEGPALPVPGSENHDVVFRTIHQMKGKEDRVVVLADLGARLGFHGPFRDVFVARGSHLALAPPAEVASSTPALPGFDCGIYAHPEWDPGREDGPRRDGGLRWASERWVADGDGGERLAGPPPLRDAAGEHRAERWRLLYVAATRASDHLVVPLPRDRDAAQTRPREYWMDAFLDALDIDHAPTKGIHEVEESTGTGSPRPLAIGINDVPLIDRVAVDDQNPTPTAATVQVPAPSGWTPRYANASTLYPLVTAPDEHLLDHLQGNQLHTDREAPDESLPLSFEAFGPEVVGNVAHAVLVAAIAFGVSTNTLRSCAGPLEQRLDTVLDEEIDRTSPTERSQLREYVADTICPQFAATATWERLRDSDPLYVEEPLDAIVRDGGVSIETQNLADVVSVDPEGQWRVDDLKIGLTASDAETRRRYNVQTATYAWLLERQLEASVVATVTRLGLEPDTRTIPPAELSVEEWFADLAGLR